MSGTETERLAAARAGNRPAFDALCHTYRDEIAALCFRFLNDRDDAQDVTQEVFSRAWQRLDTYRGEALFRTWLWEIGRNLCLNHLRARKSQINQRSVSVESLPESQRRRVADAPDSAPTPEETLLHAAQHTALREALTQCAADKRWDALDWELFLLRIEQNLPYAEFARRRGRDEAYWRNRWRDKIKPALERAREKMLRETL